MLSAHVSISMIETIEAEKEGVEKRRRTDASNGNRRETEIGQGIAFDFDSKSGSK